MKVDIALILPPLELQIKYKKTQNTKKRHKNSMLFKRHTILYER